MKAVFIAPLNNRKDFGFDQIMWLRSQEMISSLEQLGVTIFPAESVDFSSQLTVSDIETFDPDFIVAPNFNYFLTATIQRKSIFNLIQKPVIALWDDPLGALSIQMVHRRHQNLVRIRRFFPSFLHRFVDSSMGWVEGVTDPIKRFRRIMNHPRVTHFSWDSGHMEAVKSLGLCKPDRVHWYPLASYSPFLNFGKHSRITPTIDVAFCGNIYLNYLYEHPYWKDEQLRKLTIQICDEKSQSLGCPIYQIMIDKIEQLSQDYRKKYSLSPNRKAFWDYYLFVVWHAGCTLPRLNMLSQVKRDVHLYGLFNDPKTIERLKPYSNLVYERNLHHFNELPQGYANVKINVCLSNGLIYQGVPSKLIDCLASGGFALSDPKNDLVRLFGEGVKRIFFNSPEELNHKIDYYLAHPSERISILEELQAIIFEKCNLKNLFSCVLATIQNDHELGNKA